jgi:hypothetical protein
MHLILRVSYELVGGNFAIAVVAAKMLTERAFETQQFFM